MTRRLSLAVAAAALAFAAGCGDDAPRSPASTGPGATTAAATPTATPAATPTATPTGQPPTARFEVARGKVVAGPRTVEVTVGSRVVIEVVTDTADELHVHGYDKELDLRAGRPGRLEFTADVAGVFEVELHSDVRLCNLRVS